MTTDYDSGGYTHEVFVVPDGSWHWAGCAGSISAFENCMDSNGAFYKYKIDNAVWEQNSHRFDFRVTDHDLYYEFNMRILHVIRDAAGSFVSYNWDQRWLFRVKDCLTKDRFLVFSGLNEKADAMLGGTFTRENYAQQNWPLLKGIKVSFGTGQNFPPIIYDALSPSFPFPGYLGVDFS